MQGLFGFSSTYKSLRAPWQLPAAQQARTPCHTRSTVLLLSSVVPEQRLGSSAASCTACLRQARWALWENRSQVFPAGFAVEIPVPQSRHCMWVAKTCSRDLTGVLGWHWWGSQSSAELGTCRRAHKGQGAQQEHSLSPPYGQCNGLVTHHAPARQLEDLLKPSLFTMLGQSFSLRCCY